MGSSNSDNDDSKFWKYGLFYYNKEDKRLFPPKRIKWMGWTINFANPYSIIAFIVLLVAILMVINIFIR